MKKAVFIFALILMSCATQIAPQKPVDLTLYNPLAVDLVKVGIDQADNEKNYSAAMASFTQAIEIDPTFAEAYFGRALAKIMLRQTDSALPDLDRAGELGNAEALRMATKIRRTKFMQQLIINL
jgi:Tfp pilus assembly protein PilF